MSLVAQRSDPPFLDEDRLLYQAQSRLCAGRPPGETRGETASLTLVVTVYVISSDDLLSCPVNHTDA
jgi:hypothetical protein